MKNKKLKSFLCFLLAFVVLFSFPLEIKAHAAALEAAWLTYAIITYMAACGIVFTATGGAQALANAVNEAWDDWTETQTEIIDITDYIEVYKGGNSGGSPDPNETGLQFGYAAAAVLAKFVEWLLNNGWAKGTKVEKEYNFGSWEAKKTSDGTSSGVWESFNCFTSIIGEVETGVYNETNYYRAPILQLGTVIENPIAYNYRTYSATEYMYIYWDDSFGFRVITKNIATGNQSRSPKNFHPLQTSKAFGFNSYTENFDASFKQITFAYFDNLLYFGFIGKDGMLYLGSFIQHGMPDIDKSSLSASITIPDEVPDISPSTDTEALRINLTEIFGDNKPDTVEEAADIIENVITDTGKLPNPKPQITTDTNLNPSPSPVPTPAPTPVIEDIDDLGLPALGEALFTRFPFSLPRDILALFKILSAEPQTPKWSVDLTGEALGISSEFVIDFSNFEMLGTICRWFSVISFALFLILITKGMIGW